MEVIEQLKRQYLKKLPKFSYSNSGKVIPHPNRPNDTNYRIEYFTAQLNKINRHGVGIDNRFLIAVYVPDTINRISLEFHVKVRDNVARCITVAEWHRDTANYTIAELLEQSHTLPISRDSESKEIRHPVMPHQEEVVETPYTDTGYIDQSPIKVFNGKRYTRVELVSPCKSMTIGIHFNATLYCDYNSDVVIEMLNIHGKSRDKWDKLARYRILYIEVYNMPYRYAKLDPQKSKIELIGHDNCPIEY